MSPRVPCPIHLQRLESCSLCRHRGNTWDDKMPDMIHLTRFNFAAEP